MAERRGTRLPNADASAMPDPDKTKRRGGGGKLARSETVTVRLDPKLRYLAELAARKQRRTLSSFIEWAIEETLKTVYLERSDFGSASFSLADEASALWDVDEPERFAKLAFRYPDMLTHEEQILWKLVRENGALWKGRFEKSTFDWTWTIQESSIDFQNLRKHWQEFIAVARGEAEASTLPTWKKYESPF